MTVGAFWKKLQIEFPDLANEVRHMQPKEGIAYIVERQGLDMDWGGDTPFVRVLDRVWEQLVEQAGDTILAWVKVLP